MPKRDLSRDQSEPDDSREQSYVPKTPGDWTDPDPRTVGEALDDLSATRGEKHYTLYAGPGLVV